jgi:phage-related protein
MLKNIYFYVDERGHKPVKEFIDSLPLRDQAKVLAYLDELKKQGHNLRRPMADYLGEGIYELRPKDNRIFYFFFLKDSAVLLHTLRKKTDKIPSGDLDLCLKRRKQVEAGAGLEKLDN